MTIIYKIHLAVKRFMNTTAQDNDHKVIIPIRKIITNNPLLLGMSWQQRSRNKQNTLEKPCLCCHLMRIRTDCTLTANLSGETTATTDDNSTWLQSLRSGTRNKYTARGFGHYSTVLICKF